MAWQHVRVCVCVCTPGSKQADKKVSPLKHVVRNLRRAVSKRRAVGGWWSCLCSRPNPARSVRIKLETGSYGLSRVPVPVSVPIPGGTGTVHRVAMCPEQAGRGNEGGRPRGQRASSWICHLTPHLTGRRLARQQRLFFFSPVNRSLGL
jgi:hypothetical protein